MRKIFLMLTLVITTFISASCNNSKKEDTKQHEGHHHEDEKSHPVEYVCPMDCEKGKTYTIAGNCPVCKMELIEASHKIGDEHDKPVKQKEDSKEEKHSHTHIETDQIFK